MTDTAPLGAGGPKPSRWLPRPRSLRLRAVLVVLSAVITPLVFVWLSEMADASEGLAMGRRVQVAAERAAQELADGAVLGWFEGRFEWGPRALGHRSIVADPRSVQMKDTVNARIKYREAFRPFAPSVTAEALDDWFDLPAPAAGPARCTLSTPMVRPGPRRGGRAPWACPVSRGTAAGGGRRGIRSPTRPRSRGSSPAGAWRSASGPTVPWPSGCRASSAAR